MSPLPAAAPALISSSPAACFEPRTAASCKPLICRVHRVPRGSPGGPRQVEPPGCVNSSGKALLTPSTYVLNLTSQPRAALHLAIKPLLRARRQVTRSASSSSSRRHGADTTRGHCCPQIPPSGHRSPTRWAWAAPGTLRALHTAEMGAAAQHPSKRCTPKAVAVPLLALGVSILRSRQEAYQKGRVVPAPGSWSHKYLSCPWLRGRRFGDGRGDRVPGEGSSLGGTSPLRRERELPR